MLKRYFAPLLLASVVLAGCQSPPQGKFTPEQIAAMKSYGFNELNGDWSLGLSDTILFDKNDARLRAERLGLYFSCSTVRITRLRVSSRTLGSLLSTRETVFMDTPAAVATSSIRLRIATFLLQIGPALRQPAR